MASDTVMIRVSVETRDALREMIAEIEAAVEKKQMADPGLKAEQINPAAGALSMDQAIQLLLRARSLTKSRNKKYEAAKRLRKPPED